MASYLTQLRKLKLQQTGSPLGGSSPAAKRKDNATVLSNIADLVAQRTADDQLLKQFFVLFTDEFNWLDATDDEVRQCENALIDLVISDSSTVTSVVHQLLPQFRDVNVNGSKIDLCGQIFANVQELRKKLHQILLGSTPDVDLTGKDRELVLEVLKSHPWYKNSIDDVEAVYASMLLSSKYRNFRCFFYRTKDGKRVDFSYTRCADYVKRRSARYIDAIRRVIVELCRLFPSVIGSIAESIESVYPHYNIAIEQHTCVTRSLLYLARHVQTLRPVVYRLLFKKMTIIDAEIKRGDPLAFDEEKLGSLRSERLKEIAEKLHNSEIDISEAKEMMGDPAWFKQMYDNCNTENDIDHMTQKLDNLMVIMFDELEGVITSNMNIPTNDGLYNRPQSSTDIDDDPSSDSDVDSDREDGSRYASSTGMSDSYDIKQEHGIHDTATTSNTMQDLPCASTEVQQRSAFGYHGRRIKTEQSNDTKVVTVADVIISELFDIFEDIILPTLKCKYVQFLYMHIISLKTSWTHLFLQRMLLILYDEDTHSMRRKSAASYIASMVCRASFIKGPLVCSIVYYLFSMLGRFDYLLTYAADSATSSVNSDITPRSRNRFGESASMKSVTRLGRFYSLLQDILHIVCYHAGTLGTSPRCICYLQECSNSVCAYLECQLQPLSRLRQSVVEEAIMATSKVPSLSRLHMTLLRAKQTVFAPDTKNQKISLLNSVDSWFPFDVFPLYHSNHFIHNKYRDRNYHEDHTSSVNILIKGEPDVTPTIKRGDIMQNQAAKHAQPESQGNGGRPIEMYDDATKLKKTVTTTGSLIIRPTVSTYEQHAMDSSYQVDNNSASTGGYVENSPSASSTTTTTTEPPAYGSSVFSLQAIALNECPPIHEEDESHRIQHGGQQSLDASGSWSGTNALKAKLQEKQLRLARTKDASFEADYDFWGFNYATEESPQSESEHQLSQSGSFKRTKREDSASDSSLPDIINMPVYDTNTDRYESSDNNNLIVIGIDQLDDFELSLSSSILVNAPRRGSSRLLDMLTSTAAYKSAIINSEVTKNRHKQSRIAF